MRRAFFAALTILVVLLAGCSKAADAVPTANASSVSIPEDNDVMSFRDSAEARYLLRMNGEEYDITDYVLSCEGNRAVVDTDVLADFLGYRAETREGSNGAVKEYEGLHGEKLQFDVGTNILFLSGSPVRLIEAVGMTEDGKVTAPISFLLALGGEGLSVQREGNTLIFEIVW